MHNYIGKLAVLHNEHYDLELSQALSMRLTVPLYHSVDNKTPEVFFLCWRDGCLKLLDKELLKKGGLMVDIEPRQGEQRSWPAPKEGALAQAIGRKTRTVVDATTGWAQDSLHLFRMGYDLTCIERSPVMLELLHDAFLRLEHVDWVQRLDLSAPQLISGNAIDILAQLGDAPDCIYIDPMFPAKRKKSALPKKSMLVLRDLLGDDMDKDALFDAALQATAKRVVVKSPGYASPLGGKPAQSFKSKLLRYDVYVKGASINS
ncbi:MAG: class I SAM-dependent methyltransferase [Gammaproteobacteria bacterium]|nr:class I SAM-dependent methyltransferase [Gammaproteobacteria bacterium]MBT5966084.1 class I SAM-dependent methyltransferase [Gammaproteobacteria bacterium]